MTTASHDDPDLRARVTLSRLAEPADPVLGALVRERAAQGVLADAKAGRLPDDLQRRVQSRLQSVDVDAELSAIAAVGGRIVTPTDAEWPVAVDDLGDKAPLVLYVRGDAYLSETVDTAVAMVGMRAASDYGISVATQMAADLSEGGWSIVSGGAYGIDAAAHRGSLVVGGTTIAVLACGVDVAYPRGHEDLFASICDTGAVVSELPPGSAPHRMRFLDRNRLIAALGAGTVVVEAAARSGARTTAREASALGRAVMAVPGPVTAETSVGCHRLLREDPTATLVTCAADVVELVGRMGVDLAPIPRGAVRPRDELPADVARVLDAVPVRRAQGLARIATTAGLPLSTVDAALGRLDLEGFVQRTPAGWRLPPRSPEETPSLG